MDIVTKDFPVTDVAPSDEYPYGAFEVILSAPTLDRDGEVIDSKAFEPLPAHITFDTDHSMTCDSVVGSGVPSYAADGTLRVKGGYCSDDRSQIIRTKVAEGHIRTTSVTFMAAEREPDSKGVDHVVKAELLNGTFTPVPSNRESVVLTAKSIVQHDVAAKVGARNSKTDADIIQGIHNYTNELGADCLGMEKTPNLRKQRPVVKSIVGSDEAQRDRVQRALTLAYPGDDQYAYVRGMFDDHFIFDVYVDGEPTDTFQQTYTDDGDVATLTGTPGDVDVVEVVTPDVDDSPSEEAAEEAAVPAAKAAGTAAESAADPEEIGRKAMADVTDAESYFRFARMSGS